MMLNKEYKGINYRLHRPNYRNWLLIKVSVIQPIDESIKDEWYSFVKANNGIWGIHGDNANKVHKLVRDYIDEFYSKMQVAS